MDERDIIAEVSAGPLRRGVAVGALIGLGVVFGKIALDPTLSGLWQGLSVLGVLEDEQVRLVHILHLFLLDHGRCFRVKYLIIKLGN